MAKPIHGNLAKRDGRSPEYYLIKYGVLVLILFSVLSMYSVAPGNKIVPDQSFEDSSLRGRSPDLILRRNLHNASSDPGSHDKDQHDSEECDPSKLVSEDVCEYLEDACEFARIHYVYIYYCSGIPKAISLGLGGLFLAIYFYLMAKAADEYFCPILEKFAALLKMSDEVAGVTLLALGNGAPDISSTFAAVVGNEMGIALGEVLGSGLFIATVVLALVSFVSDARVEKILFLRDTSVCLIGVAIIVGIVYAENITWYLAIIPLVFYAIYVGVVVVLNYTHKRKPLHETPRRGNGSISRSRSFSSNQESPNFEDSFLQDDVSELEEEIEDLESLSLSDYDYWSFSLWMERFKRRPLLRKILYSLTLPLRLALAITTFQISQWNRPASIIIPIYSPFLILIAIQKIDYEIPTQSFLGMNIPLLAVLLLIGVAFAFIVRFTTKDEEPPKYQFVFTLWGLLMALLWLYVVADEAVAIIQTLGVIFRIPSLILGATVLAWGNSLGDVVANVITAKNGMPRMAIAACFAGPCFNILFGLGFSLTYRTLSILPKAYPVTGQPMYYLTVAALAVALLSSMIAIIASRSNVIAKPYGIYLCLLYVGYNVVALLHAFGIVFPDKKE